ncbi:MAG: glycine cleavage system aminomethyltransferase GcvT [Acidobacteriota bacterium]|nr:glycine cleavage system aminomethyltransferase GcvT [Acidobacteriota bacterium]
MPEPLRTELYAEHVAAGARLAEFAGYELPIHYAGSRAPVQDEHLAVRHACGLFDVSHMGQVEVLGEDAEAFLQRVLSNDVARMAVPRADGAAGSGRAQYSVLCAADGGVLDDLIAYRLSAGRYLLVTNAANHRSDCRWLSEQCEGFAVEVRDRASDYAMLAVQGPTARALLTSLAELALPARMRTGTGRLAGVEVIAAGSGYTGEDGLELLCDPADATRLWRALVAAGARPAGLAARDTLRLEACLPLYGHELSAERGPIAAGLGWCCREETGFIGADAIAVERREGPAQRLVAFVLKGSGIPRAGNPVLGGGVVTSGTLSPCLGIGIGLAYVPAQSAAIGTELEIDVRGRVRAATITEQPFVAKHT